LPQIEHFLTNAFEWSRKKQIQPNSQAHYALTMFHQLKFFFWYVIASSHEQFSLIGATGFVFFTPVPASRSTPS
jgi:hypothetical protein